jgi:hypothetical protein
MRIVGRAFAGKKITDLDEPALETFIKNLPHEARGKANIRTKLSQLLSFCRRQKQVRKLAGYGADGKPWPKDVLRHTYGSYWLAIHKDRAHLAELMGNSLAVIKSSYKRAIPVGQAETFWALQPHQEDMRSRIVNFRTA